MIFDFLKLRGSVADFGEKLSSVRQQIELVRRDMEFVAYGPAHPDDILEAASQWLKGKEQKYSDLFKSRIFPHFTKSPADIGGNEWSKNIYYQNLHFDGKEDFIFVGMIGVDRFMQIFREQIAEMKPGDYGLKKADRGPEMERLQKRLEILQTEERELLDGAAAAGFVVN